ncbi:hypothetical protein ACIBP6_09135 [Nonomuraea terrae]|uniref:hypothetical protein n=1 Tax=Nonomuraea terrae TaxID=2530383 RepID=UPI0037902E05
MIAICRPRSSRARCTTITALVALTVLAALGAAADLAVRHTLPQEVYRLDERVARQWCVAARTVPPSRLPDPLPLSGDIDMVQITDARGTVLTASAAARDRPALLGLPPGPGDPVARLSSKQHMIVAVRAGPTRTAPIVVVSHPTPALLNGHVLECLLVALVLALAAGVTAVAWTALGRLGARGLRDADKPVDQQAGPPADPPATR